MRPKNPSDDVPVVLTVAGSDSGGGAGVQADLHTLRALGVHGATAITAITAQSTTGIHEIFALPPEIVRAQIAAVLADLPVRIVKTGMLVTGAIVDLVASIDCPLVVDPVLASSSGPSLLDESGRRALLERLVPRARVLTPNLDELAWLTGFRAESADDRVDAARQLLALGARAVIVTGGHGQGDPVDWLVEPERALPLQGSRVASRATHGTGCTHASAVAAFLARGESLLEAARAAQAFVAERLRTAGVVGSGPGPLHAPG